MIKESEFLNSFEIQKLFMRRKKLKKGVGFWKGSDNRSRIWKKVEFEKGWILICWILKKGLNNLTIKCIILETEIIRIDFSLFCLIGSDWNSWSVFVDVWRQRAKTKYKKKKIDDSLSKWSFKNATAQWKKSELMYLELNQLYNTGHWIIHCIN